MYYLHPPSLNWKIIIDHFPSSLLSSTPTISNTLPLSLPILCWSAAPAPKMFLPKWYIFNGNHSITLAYWGSCYCGLSGKVVHNSYKLCLTSCKYKEKRLFMTWHKNIKIFQNHETACPAQPSSFDKITKRYLSWSWSQLDVCHDPLTRLVTATC